MRIKDVTYRQVNEEMKPERIENLNDLEVYWLRTFQMCQYKKYQIIYKRITISKASRKS